MILETIGLVAIGRLVYKGTKEAWRTRHNMKTGDPSRWDRRHDREGVIHAVRLHEESYVTEWDIDYR